MHRRMLTGSFALQMAAQRTRRCVRSWMGYQTQDPRIRWQPLKANLGIAENTNAAFEMAQGDYIGLMDHDDLLAPNALFEVVQALNTDPRPEVVYTDEDKVTMDLKEHFQPHLKPDFNLDLLRSNNYICHFFTVSRAIMEKVGGFRRELRWCPGL